MELSAPTYSASGHNTTRTVNRSLDGSVVGSRRAAQVLGARRGDADAAGKDLAGVVEHYDAVAEQAPALRGVARDRARGGMVGGLGRRASRGR